MKKYIKGILLAQIGVPVGVILFLLVNGKVSLHDWFTLDLYQQIGGLSVIGLILSTPFCLIVGVPASIMVKRYESLNICSILLICLSIPVIVHALLGSFGVIPYICAFSGGLIYWFYLDRAGVLTSKGIGRDKAAPML